VTDPNVTVIAPDADAGGVGKYAATLRNRLAERDVETTHAPIGADTDLSGYVAAANAAGRGDAVHLHFEYGLFRPKLLYAWPFLAVLLVRRLLAGTEVVVTCHEVWTPATVGRVQFVYVWLVHVLLAQTATTLVFMTDHAAADFGPTRTPRRTIPHGVPVSDRRRRPRATARETFGYSSDEPVVVQIGYVSERKGTDRFLALAARRPETEFLVAGGALRTEDEPYLADVRARADELDNVRVTGVLDEDAFHDAFRAADVAVLAYRDIRQSGILNWCFAYGLPAVCSSIPRFVDLAEECSGIVLFDGDGFGSIDAALDHALTNRERLSAAMAEYGRENSLVTVAAAYAALFYDDRGCSSQE
jgi:glycosyltransferase involved in cell wall biosynthesis